jgi:circadian clock protein KaiB
VLATENLRSFCQQHLSGCHRITVIDIGKQPAMAREHEILATPTLVRVLPEPPKMVIGSLSDTARVLRALDLAEVPKKITSVLSPTASQVGHA